MADYVMGEQTGRGGRKGNTREERGISKSGKRGGAKLLQQIRMQKSCFESYSGKNHPSKIKNHVSEVAHKEETARKLKSILVCPTFFWLQPEKGRDGPPAVG